MNKIPDYNIRVGDLGQSVITDIINEIFDEYGLLYYAETQDVLVNGVDIRIKLGSKTIMAIEVLNLQDTSYISKQRAERIRRNLRGYSKKAVIISFPENLTKDAERIFKRSKIPILFLGFQLLPEDIHRSTPIQDLYRRRSPNKRTIKALKNRLISFLQSIGFIPPVYQSKRSKGKSDVGFDQRSKIRVNSLADILIKALVKLQSNLEFSPLITSKSMSLGEIPVSNSLIGGESMSRNLDLKDLVKYCDGGSPDLYIEPRCKVCRSRFRRLYDRMYAQGIPLKDIYQKALDLEPEDNLFSYHSLRRHLRRHANRPPKLPVYEYKDDTSMILTDDEVFDITLYVIQDLSYERLLELREAINKISNEIDFPYLTIKSLEWLIIEALRRSRLENYIPLVKQRFSEYLESHPDLKT